MYWWMGFGIICLLYYVLMGMTFKRWNTSFSWFWICLGGSCIGMGLLWSVLDKTWHYAVLILVGVLLLWVGMVMLKLVRKMLPSAVKEVEVLLILGAKVQKNSISPTLERRLDAGRTYYETWGPLPIVVTGGQGKDETATEASQMAFYLNRHGVAKEDLWMEEKSTSTKENFLLAKEIFSGIENKQVGVVTSNYHMYRALKIGEEAGYLHLYGIPAKTRKLLLPNYMMREFFAEGKRKLDCFFR